MLVTEIEDRLMARLDTGSKVFEVNFDELKINDVTISFHRNNQRVGSIYNDDGTKRLMARLNTIGEEDFISFKVTRKFVAKILEKSESHGYVQQGGSTLEAYKTRMKINQEKRK